MPKEDSPFRSPSLESTQPMADEEDRLLEIVFYQRLTAIVDTLFSVWLSIYLLHSFFFAPIPRSIHWLYVMLFMGIILLSVYPTFRLVMLINSTFVAILLSLFMLTGFGVIIVALIAHLKATRELKEHGLKPGMLGMSRSTAIAQLQAQKNDVPSSEPAKERIPRIDRL